MWEAFAFIRLHFISVCLRYLSSLQILYLCLCAGSCALYMYYIFIPATRAGSTDLKLVKHAVEAYLGLPPSCELPRRRQG